MTEYVNTCILGHRSIYRLFGKWRSRRWWRRHQHPEVVDGDSYWAAVQKEG